MIRRLKSHSKGLRKMEIKPKSQEMSGSGLEETLEITRDKVVSDEITNILDNLTVPEYPVIEPEGPEEIETLPLPPEGHIGAGMKKPIRKLLPPGGNPAKDLIQSLMKSHR